MKVFLSWSGPTSHGIALILRDWLPDVIQCISPWVSSEDIDKGARWSTDIASELDSSSYGIICLTEENLNAPWINFEAGALGKSIDNSRVSPVLFNLKKSELKGPLVQFQLTVFEKEDMRKLMHSLNGAAKEQGLEPARLDKVFELWWPQLEAKLAGIPNVKPTQSSDQVTEVNSQSAILEELLDLTRANHKILRDPVSNLYPEGFTNVLALATDQALSTSREFSNILAAFYELRMYFEAHRPELEALEAFDGLEQRLIGIEKLIHILDGKGLPPWADTKMAKIKLRRFNIG